MVEPSSGQRMLLTNRVQTNVAWPQSGRQVALVPSWPQQAAPHSLIVDSTPFLSMEDIYTKHHLSIPRHEPKKESPIHHLVYGYMQPNVFLIDSLINFEIISFQCTASRQKGKQSTVTSQETGQRKFSTSSALQPKLRISKVSPEFKPQFISWQLLQQFKSQPFEFESNATA